MRYGVGAESSKYILYNVNSHYGFGNQFRSLLGCAIVALASGRRLRSIYYIIHNIVVDWDDYFTITNSSFNGLRRSSSESRNLI